MVKPKSGSLLIFFSMFFWLVKIKILRASVFFA